MGAWVYKRIRMAARCCYFSTGDVGITNWEVNINIVLKLKEWKRRAAGK